MRIEPRYYGGQRPSGLCFVSENESESKLLDEFFGKEVDDDGKIQCHRPGQIIRWVRGALRFRNEDLNE